MSNAASPEANKHHTETYRSEADWQEDMFGKGKFDPDFMPVYPGQPESEQPESDTQ